MGEDAIVTIAKRLAAGETVRDLRDMRGVAYALGASETPPQNEAAKFPWQQRLPMPPALPPAAASTPDVVVLPSYEQVKTDKMAFVEATRVIHVNTNPFNAAVLVQYHDRQAVVVNPPAAPISAGGNGPDLRFALYSPAAPGVRRADPGASR